MSIEVIRPGLLTSIQDLGRYGWRKFGVIVGGAMDPLALRVANALVGNEPEDAGLEATFVGPTLGFTADTVIAICGGDLSPRVSEVVVPNWRPVWIRSGSELRFGGAVAGCRAYLAVAGGFDVPQVLGSRGTYFRAGFGGLVHQVLSIVRNGSVVARQGGAVSLQADTICIHGDRPDAVELARQVRKALDQSGVDVRAPHAEGR